MNLWLPFGLPHNSGFYLSVSSVCGFYAKLPFSGYGWGRKREAGRRVPVLSVFLVYKWEGILGYIYPNYELYLRKSLRAFGVNEVFMIIMRKPTKKNFKL